MADQHLTKEERAAVKRLHNEIGTATAAKKLGITRTSFLAVLSGDVVRAGTIALVRQNLSSAVAELEKSS